MCPTAVPQKRCEPRSPRSTADVLDGLTITVVTVDPGYVAGEETAAVRALNGGPAKPTDKPPRPFEEGVGRLPTMVSNVETLALIPFIHRHGAEAFRAAGHVDVAGNVPRDDHRCGQATGAVRAAARRCRSASCSNSTACLPIRCTAC